MSRHEWDRTSVLVGVTCWATAASVALLFAWWFNDAHFSRLEGTSRRIVMSLSLSDPSYGERVVPATLRAFQAFLVVQAAFSMLALGATVPRALLTRNGRLWVLACGILLPLLFYSAASAARPLTEMGYLGSTVVGDLAAASLDVGDSVFVGGYRISKGPRGIEVKNLVETRSVWRVLISHAKSAWVNHRAVSVVMGALWIGLWGRALRLAIAARA